MGRKERISAMKKLLVALLLLVTTNCYGAFKTDNLTVSNRSLIQNATIPLATPYNVTTVGEFSGTPAWGTATGTYYYSVAAIDGSGVRTSIPSEDIAITVDNSTVDQVNITWLPVAGATVYAVARDTSPSNEYLVIDNCLYGAEIGQTSYSCTDTGSGNLFNISDVLPSFVPHRGVGGWIAANNITFPLDVYNDNSRIYFGDRNYSYISVGTTPFNALGQGGRPSVAIDGYSNGSSAVMINNTVGIYGPNPGIIFINTTGNGSVFLLSGAGDSMIEDLGRLSLVGGVSAGLISSSGLTRWDAFKSSQGIIGAVPAGMETAINFSSIRSGGSLGTGWNIGAIGVRADNSTNLSQYSSMHFYTTSHGENISTERLNLTHSNASFYQPTRVISDFWQTNADDSVSWQLTTRTICVDIGDCANTSATFPMIVGNGALGEGGMIKNGLFILSPEDNGNSVIALGNWNLTQSMTTEYNFTDNVYLHKDINGDVTWNLSMTDGNVTQYNTTITGIVSANGITIANETTTMAGSMRYDANGHFYGYNGTAWRQLD